MFLILYFRKIFTYFYKYADIFVVATDVAIYFSKCYNRDSFTLITVANIALTVSGTV